MSIEENKATVRRYFESWNRGDLGDVKECLGPTLSDSDRAGVEDGFTRWFVAFPNYRWIVEDVVAEGDLVAVNANSSGTHDGVFHWGSYGPWPATGRQISMREIAFFRLVDGRIAGITATWNPDDLRQQLGVPLP
jgi:predicted ester cyclase